MEGILTTCERIYGSLSGVYNTLLGCQGSIQDLNWDFIVTEYLEHGDDVTYIYQRPFLSQSEAKKIAFECSKVQI